MKYVLISFAILLLGIGCTHIVIRNGYKYDNNKKNSNCNVNVVKNVRIDSTSVKIIGRVKVGDSGFSFACGEDDAIEIFRKEACNCGADVVNIIEERRPDFLSSCYRATALLIKSNFQDSSEFKKELKSNSVDSIELKERVNKDHTKNATIITSSILGGILGGILAAVIISNLH
ncbi:MAG TPA: hypothetical protein VLX68_08860 [Chitinivibrionales bacterium]|nr:hypothetical protein [Chitinivibrionales bacterium]